MTTTSDNRSEVAVVMYDTVSQFMGLLGPAGQSVGDWADALLARALLTPRSTEVRVDDGRS